MAYFASRTLYQIIATMEILFSIVILIFASKTIKNFQDQTPDFRDGSLILLYSPAVAAGLSIFQIIGSLALLFSSRGPQSFDKEDYAVSPIPKLWFFLAFIEFGLLLFIFLGPVLHSVQPRDIQPALQEPLAEMFTYIVCNALFKPIFIWAMYTTLRMGRRK